MKKFLVLAVIALVALSTASVALADNDRGSGESRGKSWFNLGRLFERKDKDQEHRRDKRDRDDDRDDEDDEANETPKVRPFGTCREDARAAMKVSMKAAFGTFMTAKKAAHDVRVAAIVAANGDQTKITAAWQVYQTTYLTAWTSYSTAVYKAMQGFGTDFGVCKVTTPSPTPSVSVTPTPTPSTSVTPTPTPVAYSMTTVASHNTSGSCWTVVNGKVYNLTPFTTQHPGGTGAILSMCGINASSAYNNQHGSASRPLSELNGLQIGVLQ